MSVNEYRNIVQTLQENNVQFQSIEHKEVETSQEAADVRGVELKTGVKAMVLEDVESDEFLMALVPANKRVDIEKLENHTDRKLELANPDDVKERTCCRIGSVPPFGFDESLQTFFDPQIMGNGKVNFNAGLRTRSIQMKPEDLKQVIDPQMVNISK